MNIRINRVKDTYWNRVRYIIGDYDIEVGIYDGEVYNKVIDIEGIYFYQDKSSRAIHPATGKLYAPWYISDTRIRDEHGMAKGVGSAYNLEQAKQIAINYAIKEGVR